MHTVDLELKKTHYADIDFSGAVAVTCFHTVTMSAPSSRPLVLATRSGHAARGHGAADDVDGFDLFSHNKTVVEHGGPVVLSGVTQEQDALLAGSRHIAPQPLSAPADSPLYPEVLSFTQNE